MVKLDFTRKFLVIFLPFAIGFILSCLFRSMNAVLEPYIIKTLKLTMDYLGLLVACYFLAQGIFQLPLGILLDRFGPRRIQSTLFFIASMGFILCTFSKNIFLTCLAYVLMGLGMSGGLMSALKALVQNFSKDDLGVLNGFMMTAGGIGILLASSPTAMLVHVFNWRRINLIFSIITIISALIILFLVPKQKNYIQRIPVKKEIKEILQIYKNPFFWKLAPIVASVLGSFIAIQSLWIENWLRDIDHFSQETIDHYLLLIGIAMTISLLISGYVAKWAQKKSLSLLKIIEIFTICFLIDQVFIICKISVPLWLIWFLYGFFSHKFNLCYTIFANHFPKTHSGKVNAAMNTLTFITTCLIQSGIGAIIQYANSQKWNLQSAYEIAFFTTLLLQLSCYVWFVFSPNQTDISKEILLNHDTN